MSLMNELENLLRDIAEQQGGPAKPGRPRQPPRPQMAEVEIVEPVEIIEAEPVREDLSQRESLSSRDISQHAQKLGSEVANADDKVEARLHKKFDHDISHLDPKAPVTRSGSSQSPAEEIVQMLRSPSSIRNAVILSEILKRPEDRW